MPFDDRGNDNIKLTDISPLLMHDYLVKSSLADISLTDHMEDVLEQMDLLEPVPEGKRIKNVAAMMFSERPDHLFKQAQVEIVLFPEGRATGIPAIQEELRNNGSPQATIETDEERSYFLIDIPCHPDFVADKVELNADFIKDFIKGNKSKLTERQCDILFMIADDGYLTSQKISQKMGVTQRTVLTNLTFLQSMGIVRREGGRKEGHWVIMYA